MAPEQHLGQQATPATDQFGFCVALWLALHGSHPFAIARRGIRAVVDGERSPPPRRGAPSWVIRALDRGMAIDPSARHPSMNALIDRLDRPPRRRQIAIALATAGVVAGGVTTWAITRGTDQAAAFDPCPPPDERIGTIWTSRRDAIRARLSEIDATYGRARFDAAARILDRQTSGLRTAYVTTCRATRVEGRQPDSLMVKRMACLDALMEEVVIGVDQLAAADTPDAVDRATSPSSLSFSAVNSCQTEATNEVEFPVPPASREKVGALIPRIEALSITSPRDQTKDLLAEARAIVAEARTLDYPPLLASALAALSDIELALGQDEAVEATLRELTQAFALTRVYRDEALAWMRLISVLGTIRKKPAEALALVPVANAALLRAGNPLELRLELLYQQSLVLSEGNADGLATALAKYEESRALLEASTDDELGTARLARLADAWLGTGEALGKLGDFEGSERALRKSIEVNQSLWGPDTVDESYSWVSLAETLRRAGKLDDALPAAETAVRIRQARSGGDTARFAEALIMLAAVHGDRDEWDAAKLTMDRALAIMRESVDPDDIQLAPALLGHASVLRGLGQIDDAARTYGDVIALVDKAGVPSVELADALLGRGELATERRKHADALADHARAIATFETVIGRDTYRLARPLLIQGRAELLAGKPADAIAPLERAARLAPSRDILLTQSIRGWLGRALVASGRDRDRGLAMVREAVAALADVPGAKASIYATEIERWSKSR
jgi:tetratricopeptide (TPR) repeat protein